MNPYTGSAVFSSVSSSRSSGNVVSVAAFSSCIVQEPRHIWWADLLRRFEELCRLPRGWDGYDAFPVAFANANFTASMLASACPLDVPAPQIVPGSSGDLQVEWHTEKGDVELNIRGPYDVDAWRCSAPNAPNGEEIHLTTDFKVVGYWLRELSEISVAARSSAA